MTTAEALARPQVRREISAKAKADDRTVKRVLRGEGGRNSAWERVVEAMTALGVEHPQPELPVRLVVTKPSQPTKRKVVHIEGPNGEDMSDGQPVEAVGP